MCSFVEALVKSSFVSTNVKLKCVTFMQCHWHPSKQFSIQTVFFEAFSSLSQKCKKKKDFNTSVKSRTVTIPNRLHSLDTEMQNKFPVNALGCGVISFIVFFLKAGHERCLSSTTEEKNPDTSTCAHTSAHTCTHVRRHRHARMYTQLCTCVPNSRTCPHKHTHTGTQPPTYTLEEAIHTSPP